MEYVFVCSPFAGDIVRNTAYAINACKFLVKQGVTPIAPHLYFPSFLDDAVQAERQLGLDAGRDMMLSLCTRLCVFNDYGISKGMQGDIAFAKEHNIPIEYIHGLKSS